MITKENCHLRKTIASLEAKAETLKDQLEQHKRASQGEINELRQEINDYDEKLTQIK